MITEIEKLENQLEDFEMVRYRMNTEGFHYCFKHYSSFIDVDDDEFHRLRNKYLEVSEDLEQYVLKKIFFVIQFDLNHDNNRVRFRRCQ